jgi:UDPglucose--hexose-1-phosphate uridylyltransferase
MSEFRLNMSTGEWVIIAPERAKRPVDYQNRSICPPPESHSANCPFCPGNEHMCQPAVYEVGEGDRWSLRVVPNIYAAVNRSVPPVRERHGLYLRTSGYGTAEVLVESSEHNADLAHLPIPQVEEIVKAYRHRFNELSEDPHIAIVNIFKNHGAGAGASLAHPHSQIIATMVAPPHVTDQIFYAKRSFNTWGHCVYCDMIEEELRTRERIVMETAHFVAFCPFASKYPYELRVFPKRHSAIFGAITAAEEHDFAIVLHNVLLKLYLLLGNPDYNYYIRSVASSDGQVQYYHWHLAITPRLSQQAGFELGTRIYINSSSPEVCAAELRAQHIAHGTGAV